MANKYFNWPVSLRRFVRFDAARSEDVNEALDEISGAMDAVAADTQRSLKLPASERDQLLDLAAEQRANLLLGFDPQGRVAAVPGGGRFVGDWAAGVPYLVSDTVRDPASKNIYSTVVAHTSGAALEDDLAAGRVRLAVNVVDVEAARDAAAVSAALAAGQVVLAADQVDLAAGQVVLAADQVDLAAGQVVLATEQAALAAAQVDAARTIANFVGLWSALEGPLAKGVTAYHAGFFYALAADLVDVAAHEPGVDSAWVRAGGGMPAYGYEERATLRAGGGQFALVDGLGLFQHVAGSDEPDDDESCFATTAGRWLLQVAHPDALAAWQLPDDAARDEALWPLRSMVRSTVPCPVTSIAAVAAASFTATVPGATQGAAVLATPLAALAAPLSVIALVSAPDSVTVTLANPSAGAVSAGIPAHWHITVFNIYQEN